MFVGFGVDEALLAGRFEGMCGNLNGDRSDDLTTREGVLKEQYEFGQWEWMESWRVQEEEEPP